MDLRPLGLALVVTAACGGREHAPAAARREARILAGGAAPPPPAGAGQASENPFRGDRQSAAEGERTFAAMNCDGCHGGGAVGWVGPSLRDGRWRYGGSDSEIFQSIASGQPHGMPAYGGLLRPGAIWKLVTYLQSLEPPANVPTESWR
jgi:cytochrome c oxidase cbb3-type subunit III